MVVLLLLCIACDPVGHGAMAQSTTPSRQGASITATVPGKRRKNNCPNARECGLVTHTEFDELALDVTFVESYLRTVSGAVVALADVGPDKDTCETVDQSQAMDFTVVECFQENELDPPDIKLTTTCPPGFSAAIETVCWGEVVDQAQDPPAVIGRLTLLESGAFSGTAYCALSTTSSDGSGALPPGTRVRVTQLIKCSFYEEEEEGGGGGGGARAARLMGNASGAKLAAQVKVARGEARMRSARTAAAAAPHTSQQQQHGRSG